MRCALPLAVVDLNFAFISIYVHNKLFHSFPICKHGCHGKKYEKKISACFVAEIMDSSDGFFWGTPAVSSSSGSSVITNSVDGFIQQAEIIAQQVGRFQW